MKRFIFGALAAMSAFSALTACHGVSGDDGGPAENPNPTDGYYLVADKNEITADGTDMVTFRLYDPDGTELTSTSEARYINIINESTGVRLDDHAVTWTAVRNGEYVFSATCRGTASENKVTVKATGRSEVEKYFKKAAVYDITNTHCSNCPSIANALEAVSSEWKQHLEVLAIHGPFSNDDPYVLGSVGSTLLTRFGLGGYPSCIMNLNTTLEGGGRESSEFAVMIEDQLRAYPAQCGVAISKAEITTTATGCTVSVEASLASDLGGTFDLGYALLASGLPGLGSFVNQELNDVVLAISTNYMSVSTSSRFEVQAGGEYTGKYEFELTEDISDLEESLRVVVFALRPEGTGSIIDNVASCPVGGSIDYVLND